MICYIQNNLNLFFYEIITGTFSIQVFPVIDNHSKLRIKTKTTWAWKHQIFPRTTKRNLAGCCVAFLFLWCARVLRFSGLMFYSRRGRSTIMFTILTSEQGLPSRKTSLRAYLYAAGRAGLAGQGPQGGLSDSALHRPSANSIQMRLDIKIEELHTNLLLSVRFWFG